MKITSGFAAAALLFAAGAQAAGTATVTLGTRVLDDRTFGDLERQPMIGLLGDVQLGRSPVHLEWGARLSAKEETDGLDRSAALFDLSLGALIKPTAGDIRPYFSAGVASVGLSQERQISTGPNTGVRRDDSDQSFGYYAATGLMVRMGTAFVLGIDARYLGGTDFRFGSSPEFDADSYTIGLRFGWSWDNRVRLAATDAGARSTLPVAAPAATNPVTAGMPEAAAARVASVTARCDEFLRSNGYTGSCTLGEAPAGYPRLELPFPTPADSNRHNATVSAQLVDPFCAALREAGRTGTVLVSASSINYATRYDCGLRSWSAWVPR